MGRVSPKRRSMKIRQKQKRQEKLKKLRQRYIKADSSLKKEKIIAKMKRLTPWLTKEEFLAPIKEKLD